MKIKSIKLHQDTDGLKAFKDCLSLENLVLLTGSNGAGKTRLLKVIRRYVEALQSGVPESEIKEKLTVYFQEGEKIELLTKDNAKQIQIINYSHYDAKLQIPNAFSPYVIHKAKEILMECDYEETALNSLLFIEDMAKGYSEEFADGVCFQRFKEEAKENFDIQIDYDKKRKKLQLFGQDLDEMELSPGQQYLLRMAVACFQNKDDNNLIFFLDEPELHLHPKALIELVSKLRRKFSDSQFWISTHSLALISFFSITERNVTILYLKEGRVKRFRSDSSELLDGLLGAEENRFAIQQLMVTPDEYASNRFAFECYDKPLVLSGTDGNDPQVDMIRTMLSSGDVVVDYGAGRGRFLEELALGNGMTQDGKFAIDAITYFAYNKKEVEDIEDAERCKMIMEKYGSTQGNYFNDFELLRSEVAGNAKYVLLVNVLHEIRPCEWETVFHNAKSLLCADGKLVIVELEELMTGEAPYEQGFLMITSNAATELFGKEHVKKHGYPGNKRLVKYVIDQEGLNVKDVTSAIKIIKEDALGIIQKVKETVVEDRKSRFHQGIKLAFWLHQYANASLILEPDHGG